MRVAPPNMVVQKGVTPTAPVPPGGVLLPGPRLLTRMAPLPGNQITLGAAGTIQPPQTDAAIKATTSASGSLASMASLTSGDAVSSVKSQASTSLSTIKVTVPGAIPKTVVSMATAVLSADGTIVVTLPPGADPKNFVVNPASMNQAAAAGGTLPKGGAPSGE